MIRTLGRTVLPVLFAAGAAFAAGDSAVPKPPAAPDPTPEQRAAEHYNDGVASRDEAWTLEKKASQPGISDEKRAKHQAAARRAYEAARDSFEKAVAANQRMYQAWGGLGYTRRQTGDYEAALTAYDSALALKPDYGEALEYLGEAYLGLDRHGDAQRTYERLAPVDAKLANELLSAMAGWVAARRADPRAVKIGELDAFERWVGDRLEGDPVPSSLGKSRSW